MVGIYRDDVDARAVFGSQYRDIGEQCPISFLRINPPAVTRRVFFHMRCQNTLILKIVAFLVLADLGVELVILLRTGQAPARSELRLAVLAGLFGLARGASSPPPGGGQP